MSTGYLYYCASMLSKMAELTGRDSDKARYAQLAERTAEAFNRTYWNEQTGGYAANNQAANSFALFLGIVDETRIPRVVKNLADDVEKHDYHLTTGNLCTKYLMEMLTRYGHAETAYRIATQTTYPSWGYHAPERRDDAVGAMGIRHRRRDELAQPPDDGFDRLVVLQIPAGNRARRRTSRFRPVHHSPLCSRRLGIRRRRVQLGKRDDPQRLEQKERGVVAERNDSGQFGRYGVRALFARRKHHRER